jgi:hypothetical protein
VQSFLHAKEVIPKKKGVAKLVLRKIRKDEERIIKLEDVNQAACRVMRESTES